MIKTKLLATLLATFLACSHASAISVFNVLGSETKTDFNLTFLISDVHGTALASKTWTSLGNQYQHIDTDVMTSLMYWNVTFNYDSAKQEVKVEAFHKIDPHNGAVDVGGTFMWTVTRPTPTITLNNGAMRGFASKTDYKDHDDSDGKHSDKYDAVLAYTTDIGEVGFPQNPRRDELGLEITGNHRTKAVPDHTHTLGLLFIALSVSFGFKMRSSKRVS